MNDLLMRYKTRECQTRKVKRRSPYKSLIDQKAFEPKCQISKVVRKERKNKMEYGELIDDLHYSISYI